MFDNDSKNPTRAHPAPVRPGDSVAVVCPAGRVPPDHLTSGLEMLAGHFAPIPPEDLPPDGYLAASDKSRLTAVQAAFDAPGVPAVLAARGGYGSTRILDLLQLERLVNNRKWLVGSSDLTALLMDAWVRYRYPTLHGPMVAGFHKTDVRDVQLLFDLLRGAKWPGCDDLAPVSTGTVRGPLVGGNLFVLAHLCGTRTLPSNALEGAILVLEEVGEAPYRMDRCLVQLERCGVFDAVAGVVLGEATRCRPGSDGTTAEDVFARQLENFDRPVARGYPAAHGVRNLPFIHGAIVELAVERETASLTGID